MDLDRARVVRRVAVHDVDAGIVDQRMRERALRAGIA